MESKFKLEVGLRNYINPKYPDIIWFPMGTYILTSFGQTINSQGFTISIQGKDKMCLLDGSIGGNIYATHDFGKLEIKQADGSSRFDYILIYDIIRNAIHEYANEPYENIIINDLEDCSVELLNYMAQNKILLVYESIDKSSKDGVWVGNITFEGSSVFELFYDFDQINNKYIPKYNDQKIVETESRKYRLIKEVEYGDTVGYRLTDLTYPGDLILSAGSTITQMLDNIANILGEFEYFYDVLEKKSILQCQLE